VEEILQRYARLVYEQLPPVSATPFHYVFHAPQGVLVEIKVSRRDQPEPGIEDKPLGGLNPCETHCMKALLEEPGRRLTRPQVVEALKRGGWNYADFTVGRALARLVADGLARNARDRRGYFVRDACSLPPTEGKS